MPRSAGAFENGGAARWSGMLDRQRGQHQNRADQFFMYNVQEMARDKEKIIGGVERLITAYQAKKARDKIKDRKDSKGLFGLGGAILGGPVGAAVGSGIDAAYTDDPAIARQYTAIGQNAFSRAQGSLLTSLGVPDGSGSLIPNPFFAPQQPSFENLFGQGQAYSPPLPPNGGSYQGLAGYYGGPQG